MTTRKFDTAIWTTPWFEVLDYQNKLAFIYLWTNPYCTPSGVYVISKKRIEADLGYGMDTISAIFENLEPHVIWYPEKSVVWVKDFFKDQCQNSKFAKAAIKSLNGHHDIEQAFLEYNQEILEAYDCKENPF